MAGSCPSFLPCPPLLPTAFLKWVSESSGSCLFHTSHLHLWALNPSIRADPITPFPQHLLTRLSQGKSGCRSGRQGALSTSSDCGRGLC